MKKIITFLFNAKTKLISMSFLLFGLLLMLAACTKPPTCPPFGC